MSAQRGSPEGTTPAPHANGVDGVRPAAAGTGMDPTWFLHTLTTSSDLIVVIDALANITWANDAALKILGPSDAVIGSSIADFLHPEDLVRAAEVMALEAQGAFDVVPITAALYRVRTPDGSWATIEINAAPSVSDDGSFVLVGRMGGDLVLTDQLLEAVTAGEAFDRQAELVMELGRWRHPTEGYAILYRELGGAIRASASNDLSPVLRGEAPVDGAVPWDEAVRTGQDVLVSDLTAIADDDPRIGPGLRAHAIEAGFTGCLVAPVADPGHSDGACIVIWTRAEGPTMAGHGYAVSNMRRALALVLQQRSQIAVMERAARVDHLTGVVSRRRFFELLQSAANHATTALAHALLYVDLDGFKAVNDVHGHAHGDHVLAVAATRLATVAPDGATLARLGGDEFVLMPAPGCPVERLHALAQEIVDAMAVPIELAGITLQLGASVGVAVGTVGQSPVEVLDAADRALLAAKAAGRNCWVAAT